MGVVYDATTSDGDSLAVKLLRPELASDDRTVARFVQERRIFRKIDHPNVVRVDDLVAEGDLLGIAMEKVSGGDLKQRAADRSLTPTVAMRIAADVAAGLEAIHAADVVHRDLKPANILIAETPDGLQPKISDFGISRLVSEAMTRTSTTIGTPLYMAPEAADQRGADAPADIYALGAMMFELLIGTAPFNRGGTFAVLRAHAQDPPPAIGGIPTPLADLIDQMLAKAPSARPTATEVRARLLEILPLIDDATDPVAIERTGSGGAAASNDTVAIDPYGSQPGDSAETRISSEPGTGQSPGSMGVAGAAGSMGVAGAAGSMGVAGAAGSMGVAGGLGHPGASGSPSNSHPGVSGPLWGANPAVSGEPTASNAYAGGPGESGQVLGSAPMPGTTSGPSFTEPASTGGAGRGSMFLNRLPRRSTEIGVAMASLAAVIAIVAFVATRGDDGNVNAIGSTNDVTGQGSGTGGAVPESGSGSGGIDGTGGPGIFRFSNASAGTDDGELTTATTDDVSSNTTATTARATSSTSGASTTSTKPTTSTTGDSTTSTTERPTTTEQITTTTERVTTTQPAAVPIRIVSGPTVNTKGPTSFQFNYSTNDVCGTGSFTVRDKGTGTVKGSYTGDNICYGPLHGGYPQDNHPVFGGYDLEPATTYVVSITVRGTPSDGTRTAGSGSASTSFEVTTTSS